MSTVLMFTFNFTPSLRSPDSFLTGHNLFMFCLGKYKYTCDNEDTASHANFYFELPQNWSLQHPAFLEEGWLYNTLTTTIVLTKLKHIHKHFFSISSSSTVACTCNSFPCLFSRWNLVASTSCVCSVVCLIPSGKNLILLISSPIFSYLPSVSIGSFSSGSCKSYKRLNTYAYRHYRDSDTLRCE